MKKTLIFFIAMCALINPVFAAQFEWDNTSSKYKYLKDDYTYAKSEWIAYDSNGNGKVEYYYFDENEYLLVNTVTPDGYTVNEEGQWVENGRVKEEYKIDKSKNEDNKVNPAMTAPKKGEKKVENTEGIDPDMLPPKVIEAMRKIVNWCNEDGDIIIPYSKRDIKYSLEIAGYKKDIVNRALSEAKVDWNNHAIIYARYLSSKYSNDSVKRIMKEYLFTPTEIDYAITHMHSNLQKQHINPANYVGMTNEEKLNKLKSLGLDDKTAKEALKFIQSFD